MNKVKIVKEVRFVKEVKIVNVVKFVIPASDDLLTYPTILTMELIPYFCVAKLMEIGGWAKGKKAL